MKTEHGFILSAKPTNPRKRDGQDTRLSDILVSPKRPTIAILFFRLFQTEKIERGKPPDCVKTQSLVGDSVPKPL
ncbi:hypothetical protein, partial [Eubacterium callanderi]|uniref:hypothetical protein n=1 Tax=Eubacterium callanderi TaxID=53442 RepID=UPI003993471C